MTYNNSFKFILDTFIKKFTTHTKTVSLLFFIFITRQNYHDVVVTFCIATLSCMKHLEAKTNSKVNFKFKLIYQKRL